MEINYLLESVDDVAKELIDKVDSKILFLYGEMGVGKTTLIKSLVKCLGNHEEVSSPTFSIVNEYLAGQDLIYHFDLYRIKDLEEACDFGIEDYLYSNNWLIVEWPELIEPIAPERLSRIEIVLNDDYSRTLRLLN
ncbi:tRNA (adenosine(37)-N6)-threonylcarbamoyltransferase complex ATPase subunit type 1 TsaE [Seonamhaeicola sp. ML3]|uniref:tRNA (adenosine(37)-N6)-threonylcarbamoyltransferase complex ATPase subunit type 1 TsaE n=1 Tax=Seonamhaeicola sp. ML3 TaxID=2937786 RepID=UPI00200E1195|nr:tRNA (adenosine(37)-N6)-threonylcarbamoyltransferase complex ATPase subunit type 1 TsaE [Seonamhaeicola sp. ML3]